jgi:hypothetical protein
MIVKDPEELEMHDLGDESIITEPPFPPHAQLCDELDFVTKELVLRSTHEQHFRRARLPGQPQIELYDSAKVIKHCAREICTPHFDSIVSGWFGLCQYSEKIHSFSEYGVIDCKTVVTEDPGLHLVWDNDRIFIKPIPAYLTSHAFWRLVISHGTEDGRSLLAAATGYLRSYSALITHQSDFLIAQKHHILPLHWDFTSFMLFLDYFSSISDTSVSKRYTMGAFQLQTLNATSFFRRGHMYHRIHRYRYNAYFSRYYGPTLFVFATFSVALSAMQVAIAVRQAEAPMDEARGMPEAGGGGGLGGAWKHMGYAFRWFSIWSMCFAASMAVILFTMLMGLACLDGTESMQARKEAKREKRKGVR